jgi:hypothetical protein
VLENAAYIVAGMGICFGLLGLVVAALHFGRLP